MPRYRRVDPRLLADPRLEHVTELAALVHAHLLVGPPACNLPGFVSAGIGAIADSVRRPAKRVEVALRELAKAGIVEVDLDRRAIWVKAALPVAAERSDKTIKGWYATWEAIPESPLRTRYARALEGCVDGSVPAARAAWASTFGPSCERSSIEGPSPSAGSPIEARTQESETESDQESRSFERSMFAGELDHLAAPVIDHLNRRRREIYPDCEDRRNDRRSRKHLVSFLRDLVEESSCSAEEAQRVAFEILDARAAYVQQCNGEDRVREFSHLTESGPFRSRKAQAVSMALVDRFAARRSERERMAREHQRSEQQAVEEAANRQTAEAESRDARRKVVNGEIPLPRFLRSDDSP